MIKCRSTSFSQGYEYNTGDREVKFADCLFESQTQCHVQSGHNTYIDLVGKISQSLVPQLHVLYHKYLSAGKCSSLC